MKTITIVYPPIESFSSSEEAIEHAKKSKEYSSQFGIVGASIKEVIWDMHSLQLVLDNSKVIHFKANGRYLSTHALDFKENIAHKPEQIELIDYENQNSTIWDVEKICSSISNKEIAGIDINNYRVLITLKNRFLLLIAVCANVEELTSFVYLGIE